MAALPSAAWGRLSDVADWPGWYAQCESATITGGLTPGPRLALNLRPPGGRDCWTRPKLTVVDGPRQLAWRAGGLRLRADTDATLTAAGAGTDLALASTTAGRLSFAYRWALTDDAQAAFLRSMADSLTTSFAEER